MGDYFMPVSAHQIGGRIISSKSEAWPNCQRDDQRFLSDRAEHGMKNPSRFPDEG